MWSDHKQPSDKWLRSSSSSQSPFAPSKISLSSFFRLIGIYKRKEIRTKREGEHRPKPSQAKKLRAKRHTQQRVDTKK